MPLLLAMATMKKNNIEDLEEKWPKNSFKDDKPGKKVLADFCLTTLHVPGLFATRSCPIMQCREDTCFKSVFDHSWS